MKDPEDFQARRQHLVRLLEAEGFHEPAVLAAIAAEPRHLFVPPRYRSRAYENTALPIGEGQTISQPLVVALMMEALQLSPGDRVLEVGTGSGYQAALLGRLAAQVHTIERNSVLHAQARLLLEQLERRNVVCHEGDGSRGLAHLAPFDGICVTAASPVICPPLKEQLATGGRLVIPVGDRKMQALRRWTRGADGVREEEICGVRFVPLLGEFGWKVI